MRKGICISACTVILIVGDCFYAAANNYKTPFDAGMTAVTGARHLAAADHRIGNGTVRPHSPTNSTNIEQPDFTGTWYLNRDQSDDSVDKIEQAFANGSSKSRGNIANLRRVVFRGPGADKEKLERLRQSLENSLEAPESLLIDQGDSDLTIRDNQGNIRSLLTDARQHKQESRNWGAIRVITQWSRDQIVTEATIDHGSKFIETYILAPGGFQMIVALRVEDKRLKEPINIRRVYDLHGQN